MCCEPRMLCQLVRLSPDHVEQAYLNDAGLPERVKTNVRRSGAAACSVSWLDLGCQSPGLQIRGGGIARSIAQT